MSGPISYLLRAFGRDGCRSSFGQRQISLYQGDDLRWHIERFRNDFAYDSNLPLNVVAVKCEELSETEPQRIIEISDILR